MDDQNNRMTPAALLPVFYAENKLGPDGGLSSSTVRIDVTKDFHFYIPNYDARRQAVLWHDIHHLVTGYSAATFLGECEISAWEIASGCRKYWAAFIIDTSGVMLGCFIHPYKIIQAYARGRKTLNLYYDQFAREQVMQMTIDDLRKNLHLEQYPKETAPTKSDYFRFGLFLLFASAFSVVSVVQIPFIILFNIWIRLSRKGNKK